jgi:hypothetical protein
VSAAAWRTLYALFDSEWMVKSVRKGLHAASRVTGNPVAGLLAMLQRRFVYSGWPHQRPGWVNLHASRFVTRVQYDETRTERQRSAVGPRRVPLHIGFVGPFSGLLGFPAELFQGCPHHVALHVFDIEFAGAWATYLDEGTACYSSFPSTASPRVIADAINATRLDMLITIMPNPFTYDLLDRVTTPCAAFYSSTSDLLHHPGVDVQLLWQPEADYLLSSDGLFCCTTERPWTYSRVRPITGYYDRRAIDSSHMRSWNDREPLIVFHGSLDKFEGVEWRATVFHLLEEDSSLEFVFMGKNRGAALEDVIAHARRAGVESRVHYEGTFSAVRANDGRIPDPGWAKMLGYLQRARLAPNPWPMGGGSSRFEAYLAGTPSVHMGVRTDRQSWRRRQHSVCDLPLIHVSDATATTVEEYRALCRRCLYEPAFADHLAEDQLRVAESASDEQRWWAELVAVYDDWRDVQPCHETGTRVA